MEKWARWLVPPAFPVVILVALFTTWILYAGQEFTPGQKLFTSAVWLAALAVIGAVVAQRYLHRDGIADWRNGGVAYVSRDDGTRVGWTDWAVLVTRRGFIHRGSGRLRLETRLFCGLLPVAVIERVLAPGDGVHIEHEAVMRLHRTPFLAEGYMEGDQYWARYRKRFDHLVHLRQAGQQPLCLFDLASGNQTDESAGLAEKVGRLVGQAVAAAPARAR